MQYNVALGYMYTRDPMHKIRARGSGLAAVASSGRLTGSRSGRSFGCPV